MGFFAPILAGLAGGIQQIFSADSVAKLGSGIIGSLAGKAIDRAGDAKSRSDEWNFYKDQGATLSEIMGNGGVGTGSSTGQAVLGNQMAEQQRLQAQLDFQREQADLDRAVQMRGQDAALAGAELSAGASIYGSDTQNKMNEARLAMEQRRFDNIDLPKALNDIVTTTPAWKRQELLARMGADNVIATVIAGGMGIDIMDPDTVSKLSPREFRTLVNTVYGIQSRIFGEFQGAAMTTNNAVSEAGEGLGSIFDWWRGSPEMGNGRRTGGGF